MPRTSGGPMSTVMYFHLESRLRGLACRIRGRFKRGASLRGKQSGGRRCRQRLNRTRHIAQRRAGVDIHGEVCRGVMHGGLGPHPVGLVTSHPPRLTLRLCQTRIIVHSIGLQSVEVQGETVGEGVGYGAETLPPALIGDEAACRFPGHSCPLEKPVMGNLTEVHADIRMCQTS